MKKEWLQFAIGVIALITFFHITLILMSVANDCLEPLKALIRLIVPSMVLAITIWCYCKLDATR